ncbi:MAG: glucosamine-6-phosphate deaminase [Firmicutes bacterium]|nr:glucosamine-6-phosphate deaminase [Bacillota bacterium]
MRVIVTEDYEQMSKRSANIVAAQVFIKPDSVLGLATGSTVLGLYNELIKMYKEKDLDFKETKTFNLDEYIGLSKDNPNSYYFYMMNNFFKFINIDESNINIPDGKALDIKKECEEYERKIKEENGIDLQILGIGRNGHIGFNEPDVKFEATTHKVSLDEKTVKDNSRFFSDINKVPRYAISMGIKTIMLTKKIILLANGKEKAKAINKAINGPITPDTPASILQLHQDVTFIIDREASYYLDK